MYDFLLQSTFFLSLGVIIYLLARAVPRVNESGEAHHAPGFFDRLLTKLPLKEVDGWLNAFFEKFLRRLRVGLMKLDNLVNQYLKNFKKANGNGESKKDLFQQLNNDKKE